MHTGLNVIHTPATTKSSLRAISYQFAAARVKPVPQRGAAAWGTAAMRLQTMKQPRTTSPARAAVRCVRDSTNPGSSIRNL